MVKKGYKGYYYTTLIEVEEVYNDNDHIGTISTVINGIKYYIEYMSLCDNVYNDICNYGIIDNKLCKYKHGEYVLYDNCEECIIINKFDNTFVTVYFVYNICRNRLFVEEECDLKLSRKQKLINLGICPNTSI